ncbi:MAG TPA: formylglycine-generating enzyme family protein [Nevskiaceae bacterium]|nr:formylglycine-generating enzyme family protein [Nevskiaceae bacterium]
MRVFAYLLGAACSAAFSAAFAAPGDYALIRGATFDSVLPDTPGGRKATVATFRLQKVPVTNGEFLAFVSAHPEWQRGAAPSLVVDPQYLASWSAPLVLGEADASQPVTGVSWFAATAYCEAQGARLPRWHEWEWAAAADETRPDARDDPAWRQRILRWYERPAGKTLPAVGGQPANVHGVRDLHGLVWEWVEDFGAMMVGTDNRKAGDGDKMEFCGAAALTMEQKENYAVMMRVAMLSSLEARYTTTTLGFRCAKDGSE